MTATLMQRMAEMENYLREQLRSKQRKWYQASPDTYTSTKLLARNNRKPVPASPVIFKYNLKRALIITATLFITAIIGFIVFDSAEFLFSFLAIVGVLSLQDIVRALNQKDIIVIDERGITAEEIFIKWEHLLPSYIKEKNIGDDNTEYLLTLFFYDEGKDEFGDMDISLSGLGTNSTFVAAVLEHFREKALEK